MAYTPKSYRKFIETADKPKEESFHLSWHLRRKDTLTIRVDERTAKPIERININGRIFTEQPK